MTDHSGQALVRLLVALLAGLLVGLDRERAEERKGHEIFGGIRTFPLVALAGCIPMLIGGTTGMWLAIAAFAGIVGVTIVAYWRSSGEGHIGATTETAAIGTFLVGVLAGVGHLLAAGAAGLAIATLLVAKPNLEKLSRAMTTTEVAAVLELAVISGIVLPILPDRGYGPWNSLNPREIWWVVVLVAGLSFAGFIAMRLLGEKRGLVITGAVGGLVSSTAVTVAMADRSKESDSVAEPAAAAAVLASTIMALRMLVLGAIVNIGILLRLAPVCVAMAVAGGIAARFIARSQHNEAIEAGRRIENPFSLKHAAFFALIYGLILLAVRGTQEYLTSGAMLITSAVGALADVDAVTIALTRTGPGSPPWRDIVAAIALAAVVNTIVKLVIAVSRGRGRFRTLVGRGLGAMALVGVGAGVVVYVID